MEWAYIAVMTALLVGGLLLPLRRAWRHRRQALGTRRVRPLPERLVKAALVASVSVTAMWSPLLWLYGAEVLRPVALPTSVGWIGLALAAAGVGLVIAGQTQMGAAWRLGVGDDVEQFVQRGLFARARHPIYAGFGLMFVGVVLAIPGPAVVAVSAMGLVAVVLETRYEEAFLLRELGERYASYMRRTGRFLPRLRSPSASKASAEGTR